MTRAPEATAATDDPSLAAARSAYFARNGLPPDGGIDESWVRGKFGPIPFAFPNSDRRRALVPYHDLHHVVTGYGTDLSGEAQIGAWEIGSGLRAATGVVLDLLVWGLALPAQPRRVFRAFLRGRNSRNLMAYPIDDALLARRVREMRAELGVDAEPRGTSPADALAFVAWSALALALTWGPLLLLLALAW